MKPKLAVVPPAKPKVTRKATSKKLRFEVFKRDRFTCQYCGAMAPDVVLHIDHVSPVSKGGQNDILNLITACLECNSGKGARELSDDAAIKKQQGQLLELAARREQIQMLVAWRKELAALTEEQVEAIANAWASAAPGYQLNEIGLKDIRNLLGKYSFGQILDGIDTVKTVYIKLDEKGHATKESVEFGYTKIAGCARMKSEPEWKRDLYYIRGILRNRVSWIPSDCMAFLEKAYQAGVSIEYLKACARDTVSWNRFEDEVLAEMGDQG